MLYGGIIASFKSKINSEFGDNTIRASCKGGNQSNSSLFGEKFKKMLNSCDEVGKNDKCESKSENKWEYTNGKYKIGPLQFKFSGSVDELVVKGIEDYTITDKDGNTIQEEDIKSEKKFYIYASEIQKKKITIKLKVKKTVLTATVNLYLASGSQQDILNGTGQKDDLKSDDEVTINIKDNGKIIVHKTDEYGKPLSGALFAICKSNGDEIQRKSTGADGKVEFENLDINPVTKKTTYKVKEIKAPEGYTIKNSSTTLILTMDQKKQEITIKNSKRKTDNDPKDPESASEGDTITIFKCDKDTGKPLKGVKFNITIEGTTYETEATGDDGITKYKIEPDKNLPAITDLSGETTNTYTATITEVAYDNGQDNDLFGYKPDNTSHTVTIEEIIEKYGEEVPYSDEDSQPSNVYSPKNSIVLYSGDYEDPYTGKHSGKAQGYKVTAKVKYDGEDEYVKFENEKQTGNLVIQKVDNDNENKGIEVDKIPFKITLNENHWISRKYPSNIIDNITTDDEGKIVLNDVYIGKYTITELKAPMSIDEEGGYAYTVTTTDSITVTQQPSTETQKDEEVYIEDNTLKFKNEAKKGDLTIKKVNEDGKGLEGVEFEIERVGGKYPKSKITVVCDEDSNTEDGEYNVISENGKDGISTFVTNKQGEINIKGLLQNDGTKDAVYRIRETKVPEDGMGINEEKNNYGFFGNIKKENVNYGTGEKSKYDSSGKVTDRYAEITLTKGAIVTVTAKNKKDTVKELNILKVDEDTSNVVLDGVGFALYAELENGKTGWLKINDEDDIIKQLGYKAESIEIVNSEDEATKFETTEGGKISITNVISGTYYAQEMYTHPQYELKSGLIELGKLQKDQVYTIPITNRRIRCDLQGYVWEEQNLGKDNIANSLHDEKDRWVNGIKVSLYSDDDGIQRGNPVKKPIQEFVTDTEGRYLFRDLDYQHLDKYYLEFEYNGVLYTSVALNTERDEGSKAEEIPKIDRTSDGKYGSATKSREAINQRFNTISNDNSYGNIYTGEHPSGNNSTTNGQIKYNILDNGKKADVDYTSGNNGVEEYNINGQKNNVNNYYGAEKYRVISTTNINYKLKKDDIIAKENARGLGAPLDYVDRINQGIVKRDEPDMAIRLDLLNAKVDINGASNVYEYNASGMSGNNDEEADSDEGLMLTFDETVYDKYIYNEDLAWIDSSVRNNHQPLDIYLTYRMKISNQSEATNTGGLAMLLNKLDVYYESDMLELNGWGTKLTDDSKQIDDLKKLENSNSSNITNGKRLDLRKDIESNPDALNIKSNKAKYIYLQFRVNNLAKFAKEKAKTEQKIKIITEINSYTTYMQSDEIREYEQTGSNLYAGVDKDSAPGNAKNGLNTAHATYEDDTRIAPTLVLKKRKNARKMSGRVFEDSTGIIHTTQQENEDKDTLTNDGEIRQGDGKYTNGEKGIENVHVVMIDVNNQNHKYETDTNNEGEYVIPSYIPGKYIIQYIWGENKCGYNIGNYKNTIYDLSKFGNEKGEYYEYGNESRWYTNSDIKSHTKDGNSIATDLYKCSEEIANNTTHHFAGISCSGDGTYNCRDDIDTYLSNLDNKTDLSEFKEKSLISTSQQYLYLPVELESTFANSQDGNWLVVSSGLTEKNGEKEYVIKDINFGIVERARQSVELIKKVSKVKVTLANGTDLINTNVYGNNGLPGTVGVLEGQRSGVKYIRKLGIKSSDNGKIDMEIDRELLYGATLEIEYTFTFKNNSELDYKDNGHNYHRYGTTYRNGYYKENITDAKNAKITGTSDCLGDVITITPTTIVDYVDNGLTTNIMPDGYSKTDIATLKNPLNVYGQYNVNDPSTKIKYNNFMSDIAKYNTILKLATDRNQSNNEKQAFKDKEISNTNNYIYPAGEATSTITLNRLLTNNAEETYIYDNDAEIVGLTKNGGSMVGVSQHSDTDLKHEDYRIGNYNPESRDGTDEIDSDGQTDHTETVVITPPTGEDRSYTYYIIGAVALIMLATGIIVIKKVVLK